MMIITSFGHLTKAKRELFKKKNRISNYGASIAMKLSQCSVKIETTKDVLISCTFHVRPTISQTLAFHLTLQS
jgi:hypothetical protein